MRILVVGSGGREHALCWAVRRELPDASLYCAPGNPGTADVAENIPIAVDDLDRLVDAADMYGIDLTIIGPEVPLALGLADRLQAEGRAVFGPSAAAAQIESSKAFAKDVMHAAGVPTAASGTFTSLGPALSFIDAQDEPLVVKASGLAAGKGAVVCATRREARETARAMLEEQRFGSAGSEIVIEAFLEGEEVSVFALTDGRDAFLLPASQDHKRLGEGDTGPNTGGMGAYAPVSLATPELLETTAERIIAPALEEMRRRGATFSGLLYAGLMVSPAGEPSVVEFNCRFGDPETQAVLPLVTGGLVGAMESIARGHGVRPVSVDRGRSAVTTVLAARGYPDAPEKGAEIRIPTELPEDVIIFHAGTRRDNGGVLRANGGRVLTVTGVADNFGRARELSRSGAEAISFDGKIYRRDIGWREGARRSTPDA
ncbi:MAG TPA: phosphoribosylamine--glycine ligase [Gemmatimonadales bacterium]|nr:phosphoribosylamine--glycine ligase [Gemmatimonadales bacterium]